MKSESVMWFEAAAAEKASRFERWNIPLGRAGRIRMLLLGLLVIPATASAAFFVSSLGTAFSSTGSAQTVAFDAFALDPAGDNAGVCGVAIADSGRDWKVDATALLEGEGCSYILSVIADGGNQTSVHVGCVASDGPPDFSPDFAITAQTDSGVTIAPGASQDIHFRWEVAAADADLSALIYPLALPFPLTVPAACS